MTYMKTLNSNTITFLDMTDSQQLEVHISSNLPTTQIYNANTLKYIPDWTATNLTLSATVYRNATDITSSVTFFVWYRKNGSNSPVILSGKNTQTLTISTNDLVNSTGVVTYICEAYYKEKVATSQITFTRVDSGTNGSNGNSAPAVIAQYSVNGETDWTTTLNTAIHKYIRFSYDGGLVWTAAIKIAGEDGTSVSILGVAYTNVTLIVGNTIPLYSDEACTIAINTSGLTSGNGYIVGGYLCVYCEDSNSFICTGNIQGPKGDKGESHYLFIRYADNASGAGMSASPEGKSYIGFCSSTVNQAPTDTSASIWNWKKFVGEDAKSITLSSSAQVFKIDKSKVLTPSTITVTAQVSNTSITSWLYSIDGGQTFVTSVAGVSRSGNQVTITGTSLTSNTLVVKATDGVYSDTLTVYKVTDGADAPITFLTNENITFSANAQGQILGTTITSNIVGYNGTTKVAPTIGTITNVPAGMTITPSTVNNEIKLTIAIANNTTLGSALSNMGVISIPVTSPVNTTLYLSWSKVNTGLAGVGIRSTTVTYGVSNSASVRPADTTWQSTIPTVADGEYLWTRTIIDYTDDATPDTVTYTYAKQGEKGATGSSGSSVTVSSIQYQAGSSATTAPTGTWSNTVVTVAEGMYLWTKTTFSDGKTAYGVAKQGISGRGISSVTEYYLATNVFSGITTSTSGWTTTIQNMTSTNKYLWNYEVITYTDNTTSSTDPIIIGVFGSTGAAGKGIQSVTEYYLATTLSSGVTTSTTGWTTTLQTLTATNKYLWNYELITYTDKSTATINPVIIGVYGDKGDDGIGINSTTVDYGVSDSATVKPTTWQQSIPVVAEGNYLWTRTITDYTDASKADTVTYVYTKQGTKGDTGTAGTSVTVKSIKYQAGTSATAVPTGTWSDSVVAVAEGNYLWTQTTFSDNKIAYGVAKQGQKGSQGDQGPKGNDAYTVILTNESHIFAGDISNAIAGTAETQILAYNGSTQQSVTITSVNGKTATTTDTDTGVAGLKFKCSALSGTNPKITFTCTTAFVSKSGSIPIVLSIGGVSFTKMFTYSIAFKGSTGAQGPVGKGVLSIVEEYYQSTSATAQTGGTWTTTPPTWADGKYIWTRSIITYTDNTTSTTSPICTTGQKGATGGTGNTGVGVSSVDVWYYQSTSATALNGGSWSTTAPTWVNGKYIWTKTITTYTNSTTDETAAVCVTGQKGATGVGIKSVTEYYLATASASGVTTSTSGWTTSIQTTTASKKYLWNYEVITYTDNSTSTVAPVIIGVYGDTGVTGKGISGVTEYYLATTLSSGVTTATSGWTTTMQAVTSTKRYLWNYEVITYTDNSTSTVDPVLIGVYGDKGDTGTPASLVDITPSAYYFKSTTGKDGTFTPDYIYLYPRFQTVTFSAWQYSVDGGLTWVTASGANGLTVVTHNSIANTLRVAKTSTLYTDTITSISFRCVSSNATVYDTVSIAKIYDVVDLQIEGRNLLLNSGIPVTNSAYNIKTYELTTTPVVGETYTITLKGTLGEGKSHFAAYNSGGNVTLGALARVGTSDLYTKTFTWTNSGRTDLDKSVFIYVMANSTVAESTIEWIKLEKGTLATDYTPAPEDYKSITFQIYAPNGYLLTNELQSLALHTFAYDGNIEITSGATFQWSHLIDNVWTNISDATNTTLTVTKSDVLKAKSYRCVMTYKSKTYTSTITVQDKTDAYNSIMCISSNATGSDCYWVLYTLVYSDTQEIDPLLGPIAINAPSSPVSGNYWYAVDPTNATVQLKKYNGTSWANSTDTQSLSYYWDIVDNGSTKIPLGDSAKVKVISCHDFTATATLICEVSNVEDGLLTQSSLSLTDASDPIVSTTEPTATVNGQIWIKPNTNGTYLMFVWDESKQSWISSDMDTRSKVYTSRPSSYNAGDLWITASDIDHGSYLQGTLLQAQTYNNTYNAADWSPTLRYDHDLDDIKAELDNLSQFVTITSSGLRVAARDTNGNLSEFTSLFTSEALIFYQGSKELLTLANNQLTAPKIVVESELEVNGVIRLGDLNLIIENNGSFSFAVPK